MTPVMMITICLLALFPEQGREPGKRTARKRLSKKTLDWFWFRDVFPRPEQNRYACAKYRIEYLARMHKCQRQASGGRSMKIVIKPLRIFLSFLFGPDLSKFLI